MARLFFGLFLLAIFSSRSVAEDRAANAELSEYFGSYAISCRTMVVTEYENADVLGKGQAKIIPFRMADCAKLLRPTNAKQIFAPLIALLSSPSASEERTNVPKSELAVKMNEDATAMKKMILAVHLNAHQLADTCRKIKAKPKGKKLRVCYFGAPEQNSGAVFRSVFQAMYNHRLPANEAVCTADPINRENAATTTFKNFLEEPEKQKSWIEVKASAQMDGFKCSGENCGRLLLAIMDFDPHQADMKIAKEALGFAIIPRLLNLYRGQWTAIWPYNRCIDGFECSKPAIGVPDGICTQTDSSEGSAMTIYALNLIEE